MNIVKGRPIPEINRRSKYQWSKFQVGDSIDFPASRRSAVRASLSRFKRLTDTDWTTREIEGKILRVWRTR